MHRQEDETSYTGVSEKSLVTTQPSVLVRLVPQFELGPVRVLFAVGIEGIVFDPHEVLKASSEL